MPSRPKEYIRLPGFGRKVTALMLYAEDCHLWLGPDHLLHVIGSRWYNEIYTRFYYRDIQAVMIRKTAGGTIAILTCLSLIGLIAAFSTFGILVWRWQPEVTIPICLAPGLPLLIIIFYNLIRGPTCKCHLQTAVSREELPSLGRMRTARRAMRLLEPRIQNAQGLLSGNDILQAENLILNSGPPKKQIPGNE
ncbi:MAG: hypothetical protein PHV34_02160 [Verrucomicrobiae bacterium]|nr:hypothetical protein [Verrucomicrobiae bacterium]